MEVVIMADSHGVDVVAASRVADIVATKDSPVLGVATGSSPQGLYRQLQGMVGAREIAFSDATAFALDEYVGLPESHPASYASVVAETVTQPLGFAAENVHVPLVRGDPPDKVAARYDTAIARAGGVDLQVLGIGANGHIGFNEPTSSLASRTRVKTLSAQTRHDNARFFASPEDVPTHCITQGLATILEARSIVLVASGAAKAAAVAAAVEGPLTAMVPASVLQTHPDATIIVDEQAASRLQLAEYYRYTYQHKHIVQ